MRLISTEALGPLVLRRYLHERHGVVETITQEAVVYVRPVFGFLKPASTISQRSPRGSQMQLSGASTSAP
jgi:hypothetical protein